MKVSELPNDKDLSDVLIELSDEVLEDFKAFLGGEKRMYLVGETMGEFWLSPDPKAEGQKRRLYALPMGYVPSDILDWEVAQ